MDDNEDRYLPRCVSQPPLREAVEQVERIRARALALGWKAEHLDCLPYHLGTNRIREVDARRIIADLPYPWSGSQTYWNPDLPFVRQLMRDLRLATPWGDPWEMEWDALYGEDGRMTPRGKPSKEAIAAHEQAQQKGEPLPTAATEKRRPKRAAPGERQMNLV